MIVAREVFKLNQKRNGDKLQLATDEEDLSASGDFKQALKYAKLSLAHFTSKSDKAY